MSSETLKDRLSALNRPAIMGVLNVTPDSFSDGGQFFQHEHALQHARALLADGADIIDIGGESTRPGAANVSVQQELDRVIPIIENLRAESGVFISVDTSRPEVIIESARQGANIINDVRAMQVPGALDAVVASGLALVMYHMQGQPNHMQYSQPAYQPGPAGALMINDQQASVPNPEATEPHYEHVVNDIMAFFKLRIASCLQAGLAQDNIVIDPGFCFGKTYRHNMQLLANLSQFHALGVALCVGMSRKSFIGVATGCDVTERLYGTIATSVLAAQQGVQMIRVHDVKPTMDAIKIVQAVQEIGVIA